MRTIHETIVLVRGMAEGDDTLAEAAQAVLWALPGCRLNQDAERILCECSIDVLTAILHTLAIKPTCGDAMHWLNTELRHFAGADLILGRI